MPTPQLERIVDQLVFLIDPSLTRTREAMNKRPGDIKRLLLEFASAIENSLQTMSKAGETPKGGAEAAEADADQETEGQR